MGSPIKGSVNLRPDSTGNALEERQRVAVPSSGPLAHLRAVVLMSGAIRTADLARMIGRSVLDLPIQSGLSIMERWRDEVVELARHLGRNELQLRVMVDRASVLPARPDAGPELVVSVQHDPKDYRGTAGLIRDIAVDYHDDDVLLVANGNQVLLEPLTSLVSELSDRGGDISFLAHEDGTPVGLKLIRVGAIRGVRDRGYMDFKEQVLPQLAKEHDVRVVSRGQATGLPVRTLDGYVAALSAHHRRLAGRPIFEDDLGSERWFSTFAIVEPGAEVAATARIHDSVVLRGARIGPKSVVVRSVIAGGRNIPPGTVVSDRVVDRTTDLSPRAMG